MAKILEVSVSKFPEIIEVGLEATIISVHVEIEFHPIDHRLHMEYVLYLYAYDIRGKIDIPVLLNNWDESNISYIPQETEDDLLGKTSNHIVVKSKLQSVDSELKLKLGVLHRNKHYERRHLKIFAELIPAIGLASKWSDTLELELEH